MKTSKYPLTNKQLFYFLLIIVTHCCSCQHNDYPRTSILDTISSKKLYGNTRTFIKKDTSQNKVTFTVIYNVHLDTTIIDSHLGTILETHQLKITTPFEIDDNIKGFTLVPVSKLNYSIEIGKEISLLKGVVMVTVNHVEKGVKSIE